MLADFKKSVFMLRVNVIIKGLFQELMEKFS